MKKMKSFRLLLSNLVSCLYSKADDESLSWDLICANIHLFLFNSFCLTLSLIGLTISHKLDSDSLITSLAYIIKKMMKKMESCRLLLSNLVSCIYSKADDESLSWDLICANIPWLPLEFLLPITLTYRLN